MTGDFTARAVSARRIAADTADIWFELPEEARGISPEPGQFAHISAAGAFLRRPISIAGYGAPQNRIRLIVRIAGAGTEKIAGMVPGDPAQILLPLGSPFPRISPEGGGIWLVGGGVGAAPLMFAAKHMPVTKSFIGFRDAASSFGEDELQTSCEVSRVIGGFVTDSVARALETERPDAIFACGPAPMLSALQKICGTAGVTAFASLEAAMGCGVGACLVCCHAIKKQGEKTWYKRVCKDGPVFDLSEAVFQ